MLLYPGFTAQDLVGPQLMFAAAMDRRVHLVAKTMAPVPCDTGFSIVPTTTLAECPKDLEILFAPGGSDGTAEAMLDTELLDFLADRGSRARYITAVCTGTLVLGAAGLLKGRRAATHWVATEVLPLLDVTPVNQRVVVDGNCITGGGVTAGLDFGLYILAQLKGEDYARAAQLSFEYAPQPPFNAGTPETAGADAVNMITSMYAPLVDVYKTAARTARSRLAAQNS
jgi:cyclohexyl-isocyanide hydratase